MTGMRRPGGVTLCAVAIAAAATILAQEKTPFKSGASTVAVYTT